MRPEDREAIKTHIKTMSEYVVTALCDVENVANQTPLATNRPRAISSYPMSRPLTTNKVNSLPSFLSHAQSGL